MVLFIFDFDDTLFASSYFSNKNPYFSKDPCYCLELSRSIDTILKLASSFGHVRIITNAEKNWIAFCLEKYLPDCFTLAELYKDDKIFSSFDQGISMIENDKTKWKTLAFQKIIPEYIQTISPKEIICFGDTLYDRLAAIDIRNYSPQLSVKNILLIGQPTLEVLLQEHKLIEKYIPEMIKYNGNLDLTFAVFVGDQTNSSESIMEKSSSEVSLNKSSSCVISN
jgi:hypothetical protein